MVSLFVLFVGLHILLQFSWCNLALKAGDGRLMKEVGAATKSQLNNPRL